jgi:hypothetical protein
MIGVAGTVSKAWMAEAIGVSFDRAYYFDPVRRHAVDARCHQHLDQTLGDLGLFFTESNLGQRSFWRPEQVLVGGIQPNMILGLLVGADFVPHESMDADVTPTPLKGTSIERLPPIERLLEHKIVRTFEHQLQAVAGQNQFEPVPPFFWDGSGRAAIHGILTSAQKLFGESIFVDMATDREACRKLFDWIGDVTIGLVQHFANRARRQIDQVHVGECSGCMIGPELYADLVVPTLSRIGREVGPVRLHSCGTSDHLLEAVQGMENLTELDLGGGTSVRKVRELFGPHMPICIAPLVDDLRANGPEGLLAWAESVLRENGGGPLTFIYHLEPGFATDHLRRLHERARVEWPSMAEEGGYNGSCRG